MPAHKEVPKVVLRKSNPMEGTRLSLLNGVDAHQQHFTLPKIVSPVPSPRASKKSFPLSPSPTRSCRALFRLT